MRCEGHPATPDESAEILEAAGGDYCLSQTYPFGAALARAYPEYRHDPCVFRFANGVRLLLPLIRVARRPGSLRCIEAMPLSLSGSPVSDGGPIEPGHLRAALRTLRADSLQISTGAVSSAGTALRSALPAGAAVRSTSHVLPLCPDFEVIWNGRFSSKVRNQCRTARRRGISVVAASNPSDFETYHSLYVESTIRWGYASPPYPAALFGELSGLLGRGVELKLAYFEGRPIAGILVFVGRRSKLYWSGAMLKAYSAYCPNNALLEAAVREACQQGFASFDFGSSGPLDSVRRFKESFGAEEVECWNFQTTSLRYRALMRLKSAVRRLVPR